MAVGDGAVATGIPRPKAVREADALAGVRDPPATRVSVSPSATSTTRPQTSESAAADGALGRA